MTITTLSSRELERHPSRARKTAESGPVFISHRKKVAYVLLSIAEYQRLQGNIVASQPEESPGAHTHVDEEKQR